MSIMTKKSCVVHFRKKVGPNLNVFLPKKKSFVYKIKLNHHTDVICTFFLL